MAKATANPEVTYKPGQWKFLERNRNMTDYVFIYVLGIISAIWIGVCAFGFFNKIMGNLTAPISNEFLPLLYVFSINPIRVYFYYTTREAVAAGIEFILFYVILLFCLLLLLRWISKIFTIIGIICFLCIQILYSGTTVINNIYLMIRNIKIYLTLFSYLYTIIVIMIFTFPIINIIFLITSIVCIKQVGASAVVELIKKSCRAIFFFRSIVLFFLLIIILESLIAAFMISIFAYTNVSTIIYCIHALGSVYIFSFIYVFGRAVIFGTIATWHHAQNKTEISKATILECISVIIRFHLGSVAFSATLILPVCLAIYVAYKHHTIERSGNWFCARIFKLFLILNITDYPLILTVIHGYGFFEATKKVFYLMVKNYSLSLALVKILEAVLIVMAAIAYLLSALLAQLIKQQNFDLTNSNNLSLIPNMLYVVYYPLIALLLLPITLIVRGAVETTLLYTLEKNEEDEIMPMDQLSDITHNEMV